MEELLHYVWKYKLFVLHSLETSAHQKIEVIDTGIHNKDAGPDFFNAKIKIDSTVWVGNVEIHLKSSDWYKHNHHTDKSYDSTILHVVGDIDELVFTTTGVEIPQLKLPIPNDIEEKYRFLKEIDYQPKCYSIIEKLDKLTINSWLSALQIERLESKCLRIQELLKSKKYLWQDILFITLARNFGFGLNGDTFELWAKKLPFRALDKHRDSLFQVEAIMFGLSGLLEAGSSDEYTQTLQSEFYYLKSKFSLEAVDYPWKLARIRPGSFPHIRIAQLAYYYYSNFNFIEKCLLARGIKDLYKILDFGVGEYWMLHYSFNKQHNNRNQRKVTQKTKDLILINTVIPFMYAYGKHTCNEVIVDQALTLFSEIKAENNYISRLWQSVGIEVNSAADSQALIQLQKEYCEKRKCIYCRFGYQYLVKY